MIAGRKIARWLPFRRRGRAEPPAQQMERLRRIVGILCEQLKAYQPKALKIVKRGGFYFSEIAEAIAFAMTGYWRQVPLTTGGADTVFSETFIIGHEEIEIRMPHRSSWAAGLGFDDFPYQTQPGMFDRFLSAGYRHTIMHAFECMPSMDGQTLATRKQNRMKIAGDRALSQAAELTRVADDIASNRLMIGGHAGGLLLFTDDRTKLSEIVQDAWGGLFVGRSEDRAGEHRPRGTAVLDGSRELPSAWASGCHQQQKLRCICLAAQLPCRGSSRLLG